MSATVVAQLGCVQAEKAESRGLERNWIGADLILLERHCLTQAVLRAKIVDVARQPSLRCPGHEANDC
jgi:hypothetical protein